MGSQPEGSAVQKNCTSSPMRMIASLGGIPTIRVAASQVAPQGAPRTTSILEMRPSLMSIANSGAPNSLPYFPRQACLGSAHQVGGVRTPLTLLFLPEATTGIPFLRQIKARSWDRSGCSKKSRTSSARMSSGRNGVVSSIMGGKVWSMARTSILNKLFPNRVIPSIFPCPLLFC